MSKSKSKNLGGQSSRIIMVNPNKEKRRRLKAQIQKIFEAVEDQPKPVLLNAAQKEAWT